MEETKPWHRHYDYNVPTTIRYPRLAIHNLVELPANTFPDKTALNFFGTEITFWELRTQILRFANALGALGIQKGDRVGLHLPTAPSIRLLIMRPCPWAQSLSTLIRFIRLMN